MTQILKKHPSSLNIKAGYLAKKLILNDGLRPAQVDVIPGAAGGPKGIGIQGLDQAIFGDFLEREKIHRTVIGSSIGSWRFASILAWGAKQGTERLAELYTNLYFQKNITAQEVSDICRNMLQGLIQGKENHILNHPDYHLTVLAVKSQNLMQSDKKLALAAAILGVIGTNAISRPKSGLFMQRVVAQPENGQQFKIADDGFHTHYFPLLENNVEDWLMASASIPFAMSGISNIQGAPNGVYRDGGLIDYHIDLPYQSKGIVLYPHFTDHITPGWFDKLVKWRKANSSNQDRTLLISPSQEFLKTLPLGRLPDRNDFVEKGLDQKKRIQIWNQCIAESQRMGDEFLELVEKQRLSEVIQDL